MNSIELKVFSKELEKASNWLKNARWSGLKDLRNIKLKVEWIEEVDDVIFIIIKVFNKKLRFKRLFYVPLTYLKGISYEVPPDRIINIFDQSFCEAELSHNYLKAIAKARHPLRLVLFEEDIFSQEIFSVRPISLESTNLITKVKTDRGVYVLKSYRRPESLNLEVEILKRLCSKTFKYVPKLLGLLEHTKYGPLTIITEFIDNVGDGGKVFYKELSKYLGGMEEGVNMGKAEANKLGRVTAKMHLSLYDYKDKFLRPERITEDDIATWRNRVVKLAGMLKKEGVELNSKSLSSLTSLFNSYLGRVKMRIHQDFHLGQMVYTKNGDFVITDFEGEPDRDPSERLSKEPPFRDLACMLRSFDYLTLSTFTQFYGNSLTRILRGESIKAYERALEWEEEIIKAYLKSYFSLISHKIKELTGFNLSEIRVKELLLPWVFEKALYELRYELRHRPSYVPIPLIGIKTILKGTHPLLNIDL